MNITSFSGIDMSVLFGRFRLEKILIDDFAGGRREFTGQRRTVELWFSTHAEEKASNVPSRKSKLSNNKVLIKLADLLYNTRNVTSLSKSLSCTRKKS